MDTERTIKNLEKNGFAVRYFETAEAAAEYLLSQLHGRTVGIGGSVTIGQLALYDRLCADNTVYWHGVCNTEETKKCAAQAQVYLTSANAIAETGEIVNIDGKCNRVAATLFGPKRCIFVCGVNKLRPDLQSAIKRARNIAAPLNAKRLNKKTPCAVDGRCHDCKSPERICRALCVLERPVFGIGRTEVILIGQALGY